MAPTTILWRRLDRPGDETARFPGFMLEPLEQVYRRLGDTLYRHESARRAFAAELTVDEAGMVTRHPGFAEVEPA